MSNDPYQTPVNAGTTPIKKNIPVRLGGVLAVACIIGLLVALTLPMKRSARPAAFRMQCSNNLKQIALGLQNYESQYGSFPPAVTVDSEGRPLHSWRSLILPFIEESSIYDSIDFSKPFDDPANAVAYQSSPRIYRCEATNAKPGLTTYVGVVGPDAFFHPEKARKLSEINDPSQTVMVIEQLPDQAVHWMSTHDTDDQFVLNFRPGMDFAHQHGTLVVFVNGSVQFLHADVSETNRRAILSIAGNGSVRELNEQ